MEQLKAMKEMLISQVHSQMGNLQQVDAKELGAAVDMIKDLEEAIYYCTIVEAMKEKEKTEEKHTYYYHEYPAYDREMDMNRGRMYYSGGNNGGNSSSNSSSRGGNGGSNSMHYSEHEYPNMHDYREGRSYASRKMYMESKEMNRDKLTKMKDLEKYMQELTSDIMEMIEDASPEEKQLLQKKVSTLASKMENV